MTTPYDKIVEAILSNMDEAGVWVPPWHQSGLTTPMNAVSGRRYEGINILSCWVSARSKGYDTQLWATYKQWSEAGAQVRKGERATPIVFWSQRPSKEDPKKNVWFARPFSVFNRAQVDNAPPLAEQPPELAEENRVFAAEEFVARVGQHARITEQDGRGAYYSITEDKVVIPPFARFKDAQGFYCTLLHELSHWTGHASRENRQFGKRFGDDAYALEELVAELSAVFLCCDLGIEAGPRESHAQYIGHWHRILKGNGQAFATAAASARKAAAYLTQLAEVELQDAA